MAEPIDLTKELSEDIILTITEVVMRPGKKSEPQKTERDAKLLWTQEFHYKTKSIPDPDDKSRERTIKVPMSRTEGNTKLLMEHVFEEMQTRGFVRGTEHEYLVKEVNWYLQRKSPPNLVALCCKVACHLLYDYENGGTKFHKATCDKCGKRWIGMLLDLMLVPSRVYDDIVCQTFSVLLDATKTPLSSLLVVINKKLSDVKKPMF